MSHRDIFFDETEHIYLVDGVQVPCVSDILKPLSDRAYGQVNASVLEYARQRGTATHEALELMDLGAEPDITPEIVPYINAYNEWEQIYKPKWWGIEQIVYSERYGYIGTLDRVGVLNGTEQAIVDIKTSTPTKEALVSVCLQTCAYEIAYNEQNGRNGILPEHAELVLKRYGLFLKKDGTFRFVNCQEYEAKYDFMSHKVFKQLLDINETINDLLATGKEKRRTV